MVSNSFFAKFIDCFFSASNHLFFFKLEMIVNSLSIKFSMFNTLVSVIILFFDMSPKDQRELLFHYAVIISCVIPLILYFLLSFFYKKFKNYNMMFILSIFICFQLVRFLGDLLFRYFLFRMLFHFIKQIID